MSVSLGFSPQKNQNKHLIFKKIYCLQIDVNPSQEGKNKNIFEKKYEIFLWFFYYKPEII